MPSNLPIDGHSFRRVEVLTGPPRRRRWSAAEKAAIVAESLAPGAVASTVALRHGLHRNQLYMWRRELRSGALGNAGAPGLDFVPVVAERRPLPAPGRSRSRLAAPCCAPVRASTWRFSADCPPAEGDMISALSGSLPAGRAGAGRHAAGRLPSWRRRSGGDGAVGPAAGPVLRDDFRVPLEARRPGEASRLGRQRPGADLEAAGERRVPLAAGHRRGDAAVGGAAGGVVGRAGLAADVRAAASAWPDDCGQLTRLSPKRPQAADCMVQSGHELGPRAPAERCRRAARDARRGLRRTRCRARRKGAARRRVHQLPFRTSACATSSASCSGCSSAGARRSSIPTSSSSRSRISSRRRPKPRPSRRRPTRR